MIEEEARDWIADHYGRTRLARVEAYAALLLDANRGQNLISRSTESQLWVRHLLDSAQLARFAPEARNWLDIGSGAGLPGIVLAILEEKQVMMVEPRRKRVAFLAATIDRLHLRNARVRQAEVERVSGETFDAVTARAYAPLASIFCSTMQLTDRSTIWVLPKGRSASRELAEARQAWQGVFHVEQSLTDADAQIVVAREVRPRCA